MRIAESRASCAPFIAYFAMSGRVGIVVSHSKLKERVLDGAQSIEGEPRVKNHDRATCPRAKETNSEDFCASQSPNVSSLSATPTVDN